jgi:hypothetical protein
MPELVTVAIDSVMYYNFTYCCTFVEQSSLNHIDERLRNERVPRNRSVRALIGDLVLFSSDNRVGTISRLNSGWASIVMGDDSYREVSVGGLSPLCCFESIVLDFEFFKGSEMAGTS